jgi:hypothetical protein
MVRLPTWRAVTSFAEPEKPPKAMEGSACIGLSLGLSKRHNPLCCDKYNKLFSICKTIIYAIFNKALR